MQKQVYAAQAVGLAAKEENEKIFLPSCTGRGAGVYCTGEPTDRSVGFRQLCIFAQRLHFRQSPRRMQLCPNIA